MNHCDTFGQPLRANNYISLLLGLVFLMKFIAMDSLVRSLFDNEQFVVVVNPQCKKFNPSKKKDTSYVSSLSNNQILIGGYCLSQYHIELYSWKISSPKSAFEEIQYYSPPLSTPYLKYHVPPPQV